MAERDLRTLSDRVAAKVGVAAPGAAGIARPARLPRHPGITGWHAAGRGEALMLMPGELYFGAEAGSARTLLGSCVAPEQPWRNRACTYLWPLLVHTSAPPAVDQLAGPNQLWMRSLLHQTDPVGCAAQQCLISSSAPVITGT